ncbi:MAG: DUF4276 family protein [Pseudanabaena sp. ELA645]|jgi:hypothetical protein
MIRVYIFCEGQTEETFVRELLANHFAQLDIWVNPIILRTSKIGKGGLSTYGKLKNQVEKKCKEDPNAWVTTLIDFYGLPTDFPKLVMPKGLASVEKAKIIQQSFQDDIVASNFIANLMIHEFEGLLFSEPEAFVNWCDDPQLVVNLKKIRCAFPSPEHINDGYTTAPSKRILNIFSQYDKVLHGSLVALDIGLETIRRESPIFNIWIERLESLA